MRHELKTDHEPFVDTWTGRKTFEFRKNDRDYRVGDTLLLCETYDGRPPIGDQRSIEVRVSSILHGPEYGIPMGYCVMSIVDANAKR